MSKIVLIVAVMEVAIEWREVGQYKVVEKATFKIAIDAAKVVVDIGNTGSTQNEHMKVFM